MNKEEKNLLNYLTDNENTKPREWLIHGKIVIIDEEDYGILSKYTWHIRPDKRTFYAVTNVKVGNKTHLVPMHRLLTGMSSSSIDHKNRNGLDNRKSNLRYATAKENSYNRVRKNSYGYRGVYKPKGCPSFSYQIQAQGKKYSKHGFKTVEDAAKAYDEKNRELHGEFGIRNFKD